MERAFNPHSRTDKGSASQQNCQNDRDAPVRTPPGRRARPQDHAVAIATNPSPTRLARYAAPWGGANCERHAAIDWGNGISGCDVGDQRRKPPGHRLARQAERPGVGRHHMGGQRRDGQPAEPPPRSSSRASGTTPSPSPWSMNRCWVR